MTTCILSSPPYFSYKLYKDTFHGIQVGKSSSSPPFPTSCYKKNLVSFIEFKLEWVPHLSKQNLVSINSIITVLNHIGYNNIKAGYTLSGCQIPIISSFLQFVTN